MQGGPNTNKQGNSKPIWQQGCRRAGIISPYKHYQILSY